jgi:hypothetical protein
LYGNLIYNYLWNQCLSPLRCEFESRSGEVYSIQHYSDKVCQWLAAGWWCSTGTPVSSTNSIDRHDAGNIISVISQGRMQDFKLGGGGVLTKIAPSWGRRENVWGISCEKSRFYAKKSFFFQLSREARKFWGISCEKSRFYAKISYFFQLSRETRKFWGISCGQFLT